MAGDQRRPPGWVVLLCCAVGTVLLYWPVLGNGFLADDYASLYRLLIEKQAPYREALRPLIDISFYFNYVISGLNPVSYYIFNLCIHALTCFMVYQVAMDLPFFGSRRQTAFALTAGFLFLLYPFHNEGVVWLSGRLSSMAALFGLMAIHFFLTKPWPRSLILAVLCWWVGLAAYESIIVLPALIVLLEWITFRDVRRALRTLASWGVAGAAWVALRYALVGSLVPPYAKDAVATDPVGLRFLKALGRCLLPPEENTKLMMALFAVVVLIAGLVHLLMWRRLGTRRSGWPYLALEASFLAALLPAIAFGVSTRTSEGDRLLYFPSCIFCLLAAAVLLVLLPARRWRLLICGVYGVAGMAAIAASNRHWVVASKASEFVLEKLKEAPGHVVLVNAPDEWDGAYIFRNNFTPGLVVNGIDTNRVTVTHFLTRLEYLRIAGRIEPLRKDSVVLIYPATRILLNGDSLRRAGDRVYYWDKYEWKPLPLN